MTRRFAFVFWAVLLEGCAHAKAPHASTPARESLSAPARTREIARARVWNATPIETLDLRKGPPGKGAFAPEAIVVCDYVAEKQGGTTPKFACVLPNGDQVKVRYGIDNGEIYASVIATRLFWALGFGADAYYPVRVRCRGCSVDPWEDPAKRPGETAFDFAVIERKMPGDTLESEPDQGWKWPELDDAETAPGGATRAERDALKLLASLVEHIDSKSVQQRLVCLPGDTSRVDASACAHPFLMVHDLGVTFGSGGLLSRNLNRVGAANFAEWAPQTVFREPTGCVGSVSRNFQGNLNHPVIGEAGRALLSSLLSRLSPGQIADLFTVSRVALRSRNPGSEEPPASVAEWAQAFDRKREEIRSRRCPEESRP